MKLAVRSSMKLHKQQHLKKTLDALCSQYAEEFRRSPQDFFVLRKDPILFAHRYSDFHNIEASAFLAACFAYGNVTSLCAFIERLLNILQPTPYAFLRRGPSAIRELVPHHPYYRLHKSEEILNLLRTLSLVYSRHGSLYEIFRKSYDERSTMKDVISGFVRQLTDISEKSLKFFVPSPADGSPCKRLNLFLRWMVRRDSIDFGLWREIKPADLIMPVDTHIGRVAYRLGWIETPSLTWQKAEEVTHALRNFDPEDPTRYDFSLCHESISKSPWLKSLIGGTGKS
jgi:uncharacterized protein (TIGR02757 family)